MTIFNTTIPELLNFFARSYGPDTSFYNSPNTPPEIINIVDACINSLQNNIHPTYVINDSALATLKSYCGFNFQIYPCSDSSSSFIKDDELFLSDNISLSEQIPSDACCKFFSFQDNTSDDYPYANNVDTYICSNDKIDNHICQSSPHQRLCPFYAPDHKVFTTHTLVKNDVEYAYVSYITRTLSATVDISIFDNQQNLLNKLSYSTADVAQLGLNKIKDEIISLISILHEAAFVEDDLLFDFTDHTTLTKEFDPSNSYISSLIG